MHITKELLIATGETLKGHLLDFQQDIEEAYCTVDDALTVSLQAKFKPEGSGVNTKTAIKFYTGQVKDTGDVKVKGEQLPLTFKSEFYEILFRSYAEFTALLRSMPKQCEVFKLHLARKSNPLFRQF